MNTLTVGDNAPLFNLLDENGVEVSLEETLKTSQVLVYFYPKAMTPGCTTQAQGLRDIFNELASLNTTVYGISPDASKRLLKFKERDELNFTLLSDEDHKVADDFGVWGLKKFMGKEFMGLIRTTFIIGKDGKLLKVMDKFKTKSHHDDLLNVLDELI